MRGISLTIITILLAIAVFLAYTVSQQYIRHQAIDGCLQAGRTTVQNDQGNDVIVPDGYWYDFCLKEKGVIINK